MTQVITQDLLNETVRRLVAAVNPDKLVLFGSRARGDERPGSDMDILIIKDSRLPRHKRAIGAYRALDGLGVAKDILWFTPEEIEEWSAVVNFVSTRALREGRVLYEKPS